MPSGNGKVEFKFGTKAQFQSLGQPDQNTLYFLSDTQELYLGDKSYGGGGGPGGEVDWEEIPEVQDNVHIAISQTAPEDTTALWIKYNNTEDYPLVSVNNNLPYYDEDHHKNDITALYNSPTNFNKVEGLGTTISHQGQLMPGYYPAFSSSFVIDGATYFIGIGQFDSDSFEGYINCLSEFKGTYSEIISETTVTYNDLINAQFNVTKFSDDSSFGERTGNSISYVYTDANDVVHNYILERGNEYVLLYEVTKDQGSLVFTPRFYNDEDYAAYEIMAVGIIDSDFFFKQMSFDGDYAYIPYLDENNQGIGLLTIDLSNSFSTSTAFVFGETSIMNWYQETGVYPYFSWFLGNYNGLCYFQLVGMDPNTNAPAGTYVCKVDPLDNVLVTIGADTDNTNFVPYSISKGNGTLILYGAVCATVDGQGNMSLNNFDQVCTVNLSNNTAVFGTNNVTDIGRCLNSPFIYNGESYIQEGCQMSAQNNSVICVGSPDVYTLGAGTPNKILLCNGNFENFFNVYRSRQAAISYPVDYVLVPNNDASAYIEAEAYLYDSAQEDWVRLGGNV